MPLCELGWAMRRRDFISIIGAAATTGLFAAPALAEQVRKIGVLMGMDAGDPVGQSEVRALKQGLHELGWIEGHNLQNRALLARRSARSHPSLREGACWTEVRGHCRALHSSCGGTPWGNARHSDRFHVCLRSHRQRLRPELRPTRGQCYRLSNLRTHDRRQVAANPDGHMRLSHGDVRFPSRPARCTQGVPTRTHRLQIHGSIAVGIPLSYGPPGTSRLG